MYGLRLKYFAIHTYFEGAFEDTGNLLYQVKIKTKYKVSDFKKIFLPNLQRLRLSRTTRLSPKFTKATTLFLIWKFLLSFLQGYFCCYFVCTFSCPVLENQNVPFRCCWNVFRFWRATKNCTLKIKHRLCSGCSWHGELEVQWLFTCCLSISWTKTSYKSNEQPPLSSCRGLFDN